ncbi:hypothetical protein LQW54_013074 [Pestalotiopsis sp. IQ-011]
MFYRPWEDLPYDPSFPSGLKELGYFVNETDEIRSIENPDNYFKFHIDKNDRHNERQRFAMNEAIEKVVHSRLESLGLEKIRLPLGASPDEPNVPILVSADIKTKSRVILIIGETYQDLGIVAHRILGGRGGVNKGSMVSVVETLQSQPSSSTDPTAPGFILANTGQLIWHESLKRCHTIPGTVGVQMPSAVHAGIKWHVEVGRDRVEGNTTAKEHIKTIFESIVPTLLNPEAGIDIVAIGDGADELEKYLDWSETWKKLADRINCLAILGGYYDSEFMQCQAFREFMRELGAPVFSGGAPHFIETLLVHALPHLASWMLEVTMAGKKKYRNPEMTIVYFDPKTDVSEPDWSKWQNAPEGEEPPIDFGQVDPLCDISDEVERGKDKTTEDESDDDDRDEEIKAIEKSLKSVNIEK